ncbi:ABC transporter permease [Nostocoides sp. HKS02]|uniref:ABC transporter permease n=1 Tax=Nostocoides sp. HKS02 TaxID=1813880 RepID=UPI0012B46912|nr:ABC transporter permease [Tetrasphaera sp. HKS02]QGN57196.1 ABC transporter permease [Tetrasphaera sp. HKS02]
MSAARAEAAYPGTPGTPGTPGIPGTPGTTPASPWRRVLAQARFEAGTLLRNGEQLLVAVVLPAAVLVGLVHTHAISLGSGRRVDLAVPGVLALCVISSAFTGQAISTGFDRRYGVLRLLGVTPLGRTGLLLAKAVAVLAVVALQFAVIGALGAALGWDPALRGIPAALVSTLLGTWAFVALALLLGGTLRAEGVLALANLIWVALLGLGGVVVSGTELPRSLAPFVELLPSGALGDGLRGALVSGQARLGDWLVLAAWALVATLLARRFFRWAD